MLNFLGPHQQAQTGIETHDVTYSVPDQHSLYPSRQHTLVFYTKRVMPGSKKNCPHGSEPPVAGTGHPGLYTGWRILPTRPATSHKPI